MSIVIVSVFVLFVFVVVVECNIVYVFVFVFDQEKCILTQPWYVFENISLRNFLRD